MHEEAQSGEAAHAAYKGGLAPDLARRLHGFLEISANPPALPARSWNSSEAAAEELFRCDFGCISSRARHFRKLASSLINMQSMRSAGDCGHVQASGHKRRWVHQ